MEVWDYSKDFSDGRMWVTIHTLSATWLLERTSPRKGRTSWWCYKLSYTPVGWKKPTWTAVIYQSGWLNMFLLNLVEFDFTLVRSAQWIMIETLSFWVSYSVMMRLVMLTTPICHILLNSNFLFLSFLHPLLFSWNICKLTIYLSVMRQKPNDWLRIVNVFLNIRLKSFIKESAETQLTTMNPRSCLSCFQQHILMHPLKLELLHN